MRRYLLIVTGLIALSAPAAAFAAPPSAGAQLKFRPLPIPAGAVIAGSDGTRRFAFDMAGPRPAYPANWTAGLVDLASRKSTPIALPHPDCPVFASPGGLASQCQQQWDVPPNMLPPIFTRTYAAPDWTSLPMGFSTNWNDGPEGFTVSAIAVGTRWLSLTTSTYHVQNVTRFVARDGSTATADGPTTVGSRAVPDLDQADLKAPICSPLRRPTVSSAVPISNFYGTFLYSKPWAVDAGSTENLPAAPYIALRHCGSTKTITVCRTSCGTPTLSGHLLAWTQGGTGYVRNLRTAKTARLRIAGHSVALQVVGTRVIATQDPGAPNAVTGLVEHLPS